MAPALGCAPAQEQAASSLKCKADELAAWVMKLTLACRAAEGYPAAMR